MKAMIKAVLAAAALWTSTPLLAAEGILDILVTSYSIPASDMAHIELYNHAGYNAVCTIQITAIVRGSTQPLVGRVQSDVDHDVQIDAHTSYAHNFYFGPGLNQIRKAWNDPRAIVSEVDTNPTALSATCRPADGGGSSSGGGGSAAVGDFHIFTDVGQAAGGQQGWTLALNSGFHTFETFGASSTALEIYDSSSRLVGSDWGYKGFAKWINGGWAANSRVEATLSAGFYYVKVIGNGFSANGGHTEVQVAYQGAHPTGVYHNDAWTMPQCSNFHGGFGSSFGCYGKFTCAYQNDDWAHNAGAARQWCRK